MTPRSHVQPYTGRARRTGGALVETAFVLPLFVTMLFSLFDFGWVLFFHQTLAFQARNAARYGAVNPGNVTAIRNMVLYNQTSGSGPGVLGLTAANVSVTRSGQGSPDDRVTIQISGYQYKVVTPGWAGSYTARPITVTVPVEN